MRIALIADTFPPLRTSGAVQLRDLSREFVRQGHALTVMLPSAELDRPWMIEDLDGVEVLRLRAPKTKDIDYVRRTIGEFVMPFAMLKPAGQSARRRALGRCRLVRPDDLPRADRPRVEEGERLQGLSDHSGHLPGVGGGHGPDGPRPAVSLLQRGGALPVLGG